MAPIFKEPAELRTLKTVVSLDAEDRKESGARDVNAFAGCGEAAFRFHHVRALRQQRSGHPTRQRRRRRLTEWMRPKVKLAGLLPAEDREIVLQLAALARDFGEIGLGICLLEFRAREVQFARRPLFHPFVLDLHRIAAEVEGAPKHGGLGIECAHGKVVRRHLRAQAEFHRLPVGRRGLRGGARLCVRVAQPAEDVHLVTQRELRLVVVEGRRRLLAGKGARRG